MKKWQEVIWKKRGRKNLEDFGQYVSNYHARGEVVQQIKAQNAAFLLNNCTLCAAMLRRWDYRIHVFRRVVNYLSY